MAAVFSGVLTLNKACEILESHGILALERFSSLKDTIEILKESEQNGRAFRIQLNINATKISVNVLTGRHNPPFMSYVCHR